MRAVEDCDERSVMRRAFPRSKDFYAGVMFVTFGLSVVVIARDYGMMLGGYIGAGYFPTIIGGLLVFVGLAMIVTSLWKGGEPLEGGWHFRPLFLVLGSVLAFAFLIRSAGLVIAGIAVVIICSMAGWDFRLGRTLVLSITLTALCVAVFVYGLGLPLKVF